MSPDRKPSINTEQEQALTMGLPKDRIDIMRRIVEGGFENVDPKIIRQIRGESYNVFTQAHLGIQLVDFNNTNIDPKIRKNQEYYKKIRSLVLEVSSFIFHPGRDFNFDRKLPRDEATLLHGELIGLKFISMQLLQGLPLKNAKEKETAQNLLKFWQEFGIKQILPK